MATNKSAAKAAKKPVKKPAKAAALQQDKKTAKKGLHVVGGTDAARDDDFVDASLIETDYDKLRARMAEAMGEYANEAKGSELIAELKRRKAGAGHTFYAHPLDLHVLEGMERINTRDFTTDARRVRVFEMSELVAARGVVNAMSVFVKGDKLIITGGETRYRGTCLAWDRHAKGELSGAPKMLPIMLEKPNINDVDRILNIHLDSESEALEPIEKAMLFQHAVDLGATPDSIATKIGKSKNHVMRLLADLADAGSVAEHHQERHHPRGWRSRSRYHPLRPQGVAGQREGHRCHTGSDCRSREDGAAAGCGLGDAQASAGGATACYRRDAGKERQWQDFRSHWRQGRRQGHRQGHRQRHRQP